MTQDKPSRNEDEYFAREDAERIKKLRARETAEREAGLRKTHYMKCPKCGSTLATESFHDIQIDRCPDCHGVWFDAGEVESLVKEENPGALQQVMTDVWASIKKLRPTA